MRSFKEFYYENIKGYRKSKDSFSDEGEETISLCDLPIYSNDASSDSFSAKVYQSSSSSSSLSSESSSTITEDDFFELSFRTSHITSPATDGYIFCGKLIPNKEPVSGSFQTSPNLLTNSSNCKDINESSKKNSQLFRWISFPSSLSKIARAGYGAKSGQIKRSVTWNKQIWRSSSSSVSQRVESSSPQIDSDNPKLSGISRWHLLSFGSVKLQHGGDLSDMRSRQCKRTKESLQPSSLDGVESKRRMMLRSSSSAVAGVALSGLVGCLACKSYDDFVEASTASIPQV